MMLLATFLILGCKTNEKAPEFPKIKFFQPIITQVCKDGQCSQLNVCKEWQLNESGKWVLVQNLPMESCNGVFGVDANDFNQVRKWIRETNTFIENNCGSKNN